MSEQPKEWSDTDIDLNGPTTLAGKLHAAAHEVGRLEDELQNAVRLLQYALENQFAGFHQSVDDEITAFINKHKK